MAYDLKSGYIVRGNGEDVPFEMEGRRQQYIAKMVSAVIAILVVLFTYKAYFEKECSHRLMLYMWQLLMQELIWQ